MNDFERLDTEGKLMSHKDVSRGLKISVLAGFFGMWWFAVAFGVPCTMLIESLTESGVVIGLIVTLQQLALLVQIPSALVFEHLKKRKKLWCMLAYVHRILWFIPAFIPLLLPKSDSVVITIVFASITLSAVFAQFCGPIWQNWMADLIPKSISGRYWGLRQSTVTISFLFSTYLAGYILDIFPKPDAGGSYLGFSIVFTYAALLGIIDIWIHSHVPEPAHGLYIVHKNLLKRIMEPLKNKDFLWMTLTFAMWNLALGLTGSFGLVYLKRNFNASYTHLALLAMSSTLGPVLFGILNGFIVDKIGARIFASMIFFLNALVSLVWFFASPANISFQMPLIGSVSMPQIVALLLVANFVSGTLCGGLVISQFHMLNLMSPKNGRGMAIAVHWSIIGLMAASGPLFGGMIMDYFTDNPVDIILPGGTVFSYYHVMITMYFIICTCICIPFMLKVKAKADDMALNQVFQSVRVGNPLRAVTTVLNIYQTAFDFNPQKKEEKKQE